MGNDTCVFCDICVCVLNVDYELLTPTVQFPSVSVDPEWCPAECLGRHVALTAPGTRGMNLWELQCMMSLARQAVRCMLDPWGEVRVQSRRVMRELEVGGGNGCVEALRGLLSSMDELRLWKSTRSLQGEKV